MESHRVDRGSRNALSDEIPVAAAIHRLQYTARSSGQQGTIRIGGQREVVQIISAVGERRGTPRATQIIGKVEAAGGPNGDAVAARRGIDGQDGKASEGGVPYPCPTCAGVQAAEKAGLGPGQQD